MKTITTMYSIDRTLWLDTKNDPFYDNIYFTFARLKQIKVI